MFSKFPASEPLGFWGDCFETTPFVSSMGMYKIQTNTHRIEYTSAQQNKYTDIEIYQNNNSNVHKHTSIKEENSKCIQSCK